MFKHMPTFSDDESELVPSKGSHRLGPEWAGRGDAQEVGMSTPHRMLPLTRVLSVGAAALAAVLIAGTFAFAGAADTSGAIHGCYNRSNGSLRIVDTAPYTCSNAEVAVTWNESGPMGPAGPQGLQGPAGEQGLTGPAGPQGP